MASGRGRRVASASAVAPSGRASASAGTPSLGVADVDGPSREPDSCHHDVMPLNGEYEPGTSAWARTQAERYEASGGAEAATLRGRPIVVVTSVGARTGKLRKTALMRVEHQGVYAVVASRGGSAEHPTWYHNLVAHPHVELQDGAVRRDCLAREVTGEERAAWWARATETWPDYDAYRAKTSRAIPVFVLEPVDSAPEPA